MSDDYNAPFNRKNQALQAFRQASRPERYRGGWSVEQTARLASIEHRAAQVRERAHRHFEEMKPEWIRREAAKVESERPAHLKHDLTQGPKPPSWANDMTQTARQEAIDAQALARVERRCTLRLYNIDDIERRMVRRLQRDRTRRR